MSDLLEFLTSKEIIVIYIIAGIACFICFIIYLVKANSAKYRMKNNTRELNKLVEQIQEEMPEVKNKKEETYQKPVLQVINNENYSNTNNASSVNELLESTAELKPVVDSVNKEVALPTTLEEKEEIKERSIMDIMPEVNKEEAISFESTVSNYQETPVYSEPLIISSTNPENYVSNDAVSYHEQIVIENTLEETSIDDTVNEIVNDEVEVSTDVVSEIPVSENIVDISLNSISEESKNEELQYTSIEPSMEDAKRELDRVREELRNKENMQDDMENIALNNYEEEQEANAIISLEELIKRSKEMYEVNEATQYADEGNEPISLQDLEKKVGEKASSFDEPFIIENVVPASELQEEILEEEPQIIKSQVIETPNVVRPIYEAPSISQMRKDLESKIDSYLTKKEITKDTVSVKETESKKFKSSPIISPIFGIEKDEETMYQTELELENTANYEKLDEEIKKTNEFLMTLRELQKKLD